MSNEISNKFGEVFSTFCYANACAFPGKKLIQAGYCKASCIVAENLNEPNVGEWNLATNHYLALAKKKCSTGFDSSCFFNCNRLCFKKWFQ